MTVNQHSKRKFLYGSVFSILLPLCTFGNSVAQTQQPEDATLLYLKGLSIEELLQTQITSVSKKSEQLFNVAAAVTVITQEDIERSGALNIPEALRLVPGLQVAQLDGSRYAISSRGFNEYFANKLLVLIDGRSVYTPLFSGVYWNAQDTMLEDVERIEVIRGPGATVWGANAVNGVINIITKNSEDTQGGLVTTKVGDYIQPEVSARYGGQIDDKTTYRIFAKGFHQKDYKDPEGGDARDAWESIRTGFRADRSHTDKDTLSFQAEVYDNEADIRSDLANIGTPGWTETNGTEKYNGGHVLTTWQHRFNDTSDIDLQFYYDYTWRDQVVAEESRDTIDLEFKHHWDPAGSHDIVWGLGYRWTSDDIDSTQYVSFDPDSRSDNLWSAFIQDDINLIPETFWITLGSKFEHNDYSGFEIQPSARARYKPTERQTIWGAVSRAVRTPSRAEHDFTAYLGNGSVNIMVPAPSPPFPPGMTLPLTVPANAYVYGTDDFDSEELIAYELGYRWQASDALSFDLATFYNVYDNLRTLEDGSPIISLNPPSVIIPAYVGNGLEGNTYGFELQGTWQATDTLKIIAAYSLIDFDLEYKDPALRGNSISDEQLTPQQQFQIRSYLDLPHNLSLDAELYYVDKLEDRDIDSYLRFDLQLSWQAKDNFRVSVGAENLFDSGHQEFPERQDILPSEIPQQFWLKASYTF